MKYSDKLKDPRWQKKRLEILQRDEWKCRCCSRQDETLHVHHVYYEKGNEPWDYPDEAFMVLCHECHKAEGEEIAEATNELIKAIKTKFLSSEIRTITQGFDYFHPFHIEGVCASVIKFFLLNPEIQQIALEHYLEFLKSNPNDKLPF